MSEKVNFNVNGIEIESDPNKLLIEACEDSEVYEVEFEIKKSLQVRLASLLEKSAERVLSRWLGKPNNDIYQ